MNPNNSLERFVRTGEQISSQYSGVVCSFLSGSLIEGVGNPLSDLDLYIIGASGEVDSDWDFAGSFIFGETRVDVGYDGEGDSIVRVDTELWTLHSVNAAAADLAGVDLNNRGACASFDEGRSQLAHRIRIGVPIVNPEMFKSLQSLFDYNRLARLLSNKFLLEYLGAAEDAAGAIQIVDAGTALLSSRIALGAAVDAHLAAYGETNQKPKWRFPKLLRHGDNELMQRYLTLEGQVELDNSSLIHSAKRRLRYAGQLAQRTQDRLAEIQVL